MNIYLINILRLVHIFAGALWLGTAIFYLFYIKPTVKSIGPAGPQFMQILVERRRMPIFMTVASLLTVVAGIMLYIYASGGFNQAWIRTGTGIGFSIGSLAGLAAFIAGTFFIGPISGRMGVIGQQIAKSGGPPSQDQLNQLHVLEKRLSRVETIDFISLTISMIAMATARYWFF
jgi:uncharacterized membrane protein